MKAKVIIENGKTRIVLTPENSFEIDVIEKVVDEKKETESTKIETDYSYYNHNNHRITIEIK